jgi:hypothetical protein
MVLRNVSVTVGQLGETIITQTIITPFYMQIWFAIAVILGIGVIVLAVWFWFRISLRNRTNVIIHMPDKTRQSFSYKNFTGTTFNIRGYEKTIEGEPVSYTYIFKPECLESGYFGRYIEYDYGVSEPLDSKKRVYANKDMPSIMKLFSSLMNSQLATDLLLSNKFKEFVKMMLIIILIVTFIILIAVIGMPFAYNPEVNCKLIPTNETAMFIRQSIIGI